MFNCENDIRPNNIHKQYKELIFTIISSTLSPIFNYSKILGFVLFAYKNLYLRFSVRNHSLIDC